MSVEIAKYIRVRCSYCGKVVRSNGKGELIYPRNRRATDEAKSYMKLYTIGLILAKLSKCGVKPPPLGVGSVSSVTSGRGCA